MLTSCLSTDTIHVDINGGEAANSAALPAVQSARTVLGSLKR